MPGLRSIRLTDRRGDVELKAVTRRAKPQRLHICPHPLCGKWYFSEAAYKQHYKETHGGR